jgi:LPXTG-site transpeptidase (sortase) family protein
MKHIPRSASFALFLFVIMSFFLPSHRIFGAITSGIQTKGTEIKFSTVSPIISTDYPVRIMAPSIKLDSPIQGMGINPKGELDVPNGKTKNVGWYKNGIIPGNTGSAVLDAHVFAAFSNLQYLKPGSDIYIEMSSGKKLHFTVDASKKYKLSELLATDLFQSTSEKRMNLITCAGALTKDRSTYDHRLIVYTSFKGEVS